MTLNFDTALAMLRAQGGIGAQVAEAYDELLALWVAQTAARERLENDLRLIRDLCERSWADEPIAARNKALIVSIPVICDHALGDGISGSDEAYPLVVAAIRALGV